MTATEKKKKIQSKEKNGNHNIVKKKGGKGKKEKKINALCDLTCKKTVFLISSMVSTPTLSMGAGLKNTVLDKLMLLRVLVSTKLQSATVLN